MPDISSPDISSDVPAPRHKALRFAVPFPSTADAFREWIAANNPPESDLSDVSVALQELHSCSEELRVAEEALVNQSEALLDAQAVVEEERLRYQELFNLAPDGYIVTDRNGVVSEANLAALAMLRISPRFAIGKPLGTFVTAEERTEFRTIISRVAKELRCSWDTILRSRDGILIPVNITVATNGGIAPGETTLRWLVRDISARRAAETALFEANQMLTALIQASPVAIAILDGSKRVTLWNAAAERILGWAAAEVVGSIPPGVPENVRVAFQMEKPTLLTRGHKGFETQLLHKNGAPVEMEIWVAPIVNNQGETTATIAVATDISERKRAAQEQRQLMQRIVSVQEDERLRLSREMHDHLGQHLTAISLGLKSLQTDGQNLPDGERREAAAKLQSLRDLVDELMQTTHRLARELRPAELDDMGLETALQRYAENWSSTTGIEVDFQNISAVQDRADSAVETTLYRVVQEALTNVARHAAAQHVSLVLKSSAGESVVVIEDDGCGFEIDSPYATQRLGLTGMRERLALVGGKLEIESAPGDGTTVFARV